MLAGDPTEAAAKAEEFLKERSLSSYYDEVGLKGLQLAQADATRGALNEARLSKIRETILEFVEDLSDVDDVEHTQGLKTRDKEAAAALEAVDEAPAVESMPVLTKQDLDPRWQTEEPVLCIAGRTVLDDACARMFAHLLGAHGLTARVEGPETLSTANLFRLQAEGAAVVCLSYLDASSPSHMRYAVRRLRRKLPNATILLGSWATNQDAATLETLRETAKADLVAGSLREAVSLCLKLGVARSEDDHTAADIPNAAKEAAA
jgi:hypothetical protein